MRSKSFLVILCCLFTCLAFADEPMYTGDIPDIPCKPGTKCTWTTTTVSWKLVDVAGVPASYDNPDKWDKTAECSEKVAGALGDAIGHGETAKLLVEFMGAYITTLGNIWLKFERTENTVVRQIECVDGTWKVNSDTPTTAKTSEWVKANTDGMPIGSLSERDVKQAIERGTNAFLKRHSGENGTPNHRHDCP